MLRFREIVAIASGSSGNWLMKIDLKYAGLLGGLALLAILSQAHAQTKEVFGYTEPYRHVKMAFAETGVISRVEVKEGQNIKEGQILVQLDVQVLLQELEISRKQMELQQTRLAKLKELEVAARVSPEELRRAATDAQVEEHKFKRTEAQIDNRTLRAPFDGIVSEIKKEVSESVNPNTPVITVVQLDKLLLTIHMAPQQAFKLRSGVPITLVIPETRESVPAKVGFVSPVTDAASGTVRVKFVIPNKLGIYKSGVRCGLAVENKSLRDEPEAGEDKGLTAY